MNSDSSITVAVHAIPSMIGEAITGRLSDRGHSVVSESDSQQWLGTAPIGIVVVTQLKDGSRIEAIRRERPDAVVIALVPESETALHADALRAGATSAISMEASAETVVDAVEAGVKGMSLMSVEAAVGLAAKFPGRRPIELSDQELGWIQGLADNVSIERIAAESSYSVRHFKRILKVVYGKLGATTRTEALTNAARQGLLNDERSSA